MPRRATAQDVADLAGVSRSAVSLVLNGRGAGNISPAKQEAIRAAAAQLRYTPDAVAISLRRQRTRTIGVLSWPGRVGETTRMLHRAHQVARQAGYQLVMTDVAGEPEVERRELALLFDRRVDGFLVVAPELVDRPPPGEELRAVPTVLTNARDPSGALTSMVPDEEGAGRAAVQALLDAGHHAVAVLVGETSTLQSRLRCAGVQAALHAAGMPPALQVVAGYDVDGGYRGARRLLAGPARPTGLVCLHERLALGAVVAAGHLGLSIPGALSVVSLEDGAKLAAQLVPPLTTVRRPDTLLAERAVQALLERLAGEEQAPAERLVFPCPLRVRASVAAPSRR